MRTRKPCPPETLAQAKNWEVVKHKYRTAGLCDRCAAQAGYAHQSHGGTWEIIHPPCPSCQPVVATFPDATPSPVWRKYSNPLRAEIPAGKVNTPAGVPVRNRNALRASEDTPSPDPVPELIHR